MIHENRGLNPYIEDVARRLAVLNFVAFAPDALTPVGGYPGDEDKARELFAQARSPRSGPRIWSPARPFSRRAPKSTGKIGAVGFCFGGGIVQPAGGAPARISRRRCRSTAARSSAEDAAKIKAPLLIHYASNDERINAGWPAYEAALKANKVRYEMHMYPNTQHGFHNDTTPRYDEAAAKLVVAADGGFLQQTLAGLTSVSSETIINRDYRRPSLAATHP